MNSDFQHLKLLSIFHYVLGGILCIFASLPIFHFVIGLVMIVSPASMGGGTPPPPFLGWIFILVAGAIILSGWLLAFCMLLAGRFLSQRTHRTFCMVVAGLSLIFQPLGTILGVFTIIVLCRPSVKHLFATGESPPFDPEDDDDRLPGDSYNIRRSDVY